MRIHAPLLPLAITMMVGIGLSQYTDSWLIPLAGLVVVLVVSCLLGRHPRWQTAGIIVCTLLFGMLVGSRRQQQLNIKWPKEKMDVDLVVMSEVKTGDKTVSFDAMTANGQHKLRCHIQRDSNSERIETGQGLRVHTNINKVHEWKHGTFDNKQYMQCHGFTGEVYANSNQWQWKAVGLQALSVTDRLRLRFLTWRHQLLAHFQQQPIDEDAYGVIAAMTLGEKTTLSKDLKDTYSRVVRRTSWH